MFQLYKKPNIVQLPTQSASEVSDIKVDQILSIRSTILRKSRGSFNIFATKPLCSYQQQAIPYNKVAIDAFDKALTDSYTKKIIQSSLSDQLGIQTLVARHLRLSRDVLASKATRLHKLQSGFTYMIASQKRRKQLFKESSEE